MKYLQSLQSKKVFTLSDVTKLTGNENTAKSLMRGYKKAGYVTSIRKNLYASLDLASGEVIANRYEIGCGVSKTAYISHHSAMEFHGVANQVFFEVTISSVENIRKFDFGGVSYRPIKTSVTEGVITPPYNPLIRVTDIERTVVDCIHDMELAGGLEEVLECLRLIPQLDERLLLEYLSAYGQKSLWQKAGYILELYRDQFRLSDGFFNTCKRNMGVRKNYLTESGKSVYHSDWRMYTPEDLLSLLNEGDDVIV